jgi:hypothetical protein
MRHIITVTCRIAEASASNFIILHPHILVIDTADRDTIAITAGSVISKVAIRSFSQERFGRTK